MTTLSKEDVVQHPTQPLVTDHQGVVRFKENKIVSFLAEGRLNELACMGFSTEDSEQLAQLIGYSLSGFGTLSYVSDETFERAQDRADLVAENERLKEENSAFRKAWNSDQLFAELRTALAAAEAREMKLHKGLENIKHYLWGGNATAAYNYTSLVLAQPRDDSALRRLLAEAKSVVYEECELACTGLKFKSDKPEHNEDDCIAAIRALAEKAKGE